MEERKYTFYDRYQKVKYANITAEELEVLNIFYNKEHYMFDQQHQRNNTVLFCGLESENGCATDFIADSGRDIASDITTEIFFKELFSDLTEKEKKIVSDYFIMGKQVKETAEELGISTRQVSRDKNSALAKMLNGLTYEEVMNGHSKIRNKGIANIFSQMGLVEAWGSGIKRILNAAEEYGLPKPRFQEFDNMFRVELFRVNPITDQANQATNQANQDLERLDQVEDENVLSEKEIEILNLVRMQPSITQKEMANALDWNLASVKYYITKLKEKNYLKRQGSSQKGKWVILTKRD